MRATLKVSVADRGEVTVLHLDGQLVFEGGDAVFRDSVNDQIARDRFKIVVDLADVTYIDSAGIGVLIARFLEVRRRGGDMRLANLTSRSHRVMTITHLLSVFDSFESVEQAVQSFQSSVGKSIP